MPAAAYAPTEHRRLAAVRRVGLLGTPAEEHFDRITRLARRLFDMPMAVIDIVGEEFMVLMADVQSGDVPSMAERIRTSLAKAPIRFGDHSIEWTCSVGYAIGAAAEEIDALVRRADRALYRAKSGGRNRVESAPAD